MMANRSARRRWLGWRTGCFVLGFVIAVLALRMVPPAPAFSPGIGRGSYWQSYESFYFASLRSYEEPIRSLLEQGKIPVVIFGDSTMRGVGAGGDDVWSKLLERRLQAQDPRVHVLNYAQNGGDRMGYLLYHHLQQKFPEAYYIVEWRFGVEVTERTPFHYWLTSEIALRDGRKNPAVRMGFDAMPIQADEWPSFVMASFNILTNYLDVGNWIRYRWLGYLNYRRFSVGKFFPNFKIENSAIRKIRLGNITLVPLQDAPEMDVSVDKFTLPDEAMQKTLRGIFTTTLGLRKKYLAESVEAREKALAELFPASVRSHLLVLTLDMNPFFAPSQDAPQMEFWRKSWTQLRQDMSRIAGLRWLSLTGAAGEMKKDDFVDLAHLTTAGQDRIGNAVADYLLTDTDWLKSGRAETTR